MFTGFPKETLTFFGDLEKNNTKKWFESHKGEYEEFVKKPSEDFVIAMGEKLESIAPEINAIPKVNQSLFRINRDTRFSKDKRPYKTNLGIWFWEGEGKRMECSGFYFHLQNKELMLGIGMHMMPKPVLEQYRNAVVDKKLAPLLKKNIQQVSKHGYSIGEKQYKRIPSGFDESHPNAEYLLFGGLTAMIELPVPGELYSKSCIDFVFNHFKKMVPIHEWLKKAIK